MVSLLEQKFKVAEKVVKIHKEARENWLSPETLLAMKDNSFKSELDVCHLLFIPARLAAAGACTLETSTR